MEMTSMKAVTEALIRVACNGDKGRVAALTARVVDGLTLEAAAEKGGVSVKVVRTDEKRLMKGTVQPGAERTGAGSQVDPSNAREQYLVNVNEKVSEKRRGGRG